MSGDGYLHRYFLNNSNKLLDKWLHYFDIYERHLERFRGKKPTMIEIGVFGGGSLQMWKSYLGEGARIIGVDINPECKRHEDENIEIFIGSQDDESLLASIVEKYGNIDIVLDDGSHMMKHMIDTFNFLYPRISPTGTYLVEDLHTCYWDNYDGGLRREGSFIEMAKGKIDELNAVHSRGTQEVTPFTRSTASICCYDSIIAFEKRPQARRQAVKTGPMRMKIGKRPGNEAEVDGEESQN